MKTLDELRKTPAHVECEHGASMRACDACECLALEAKVAELEGERESHDHEVALVRKEGEWRLNAAKAALKRDRGTRAKVKELQAQLDRATEPRADEEEGTTYLIDTLAGALRVDATSYGLTELVQAAAEKLDELCNPLNLAGEPMFPVDIDVGGGDA